MANKDQMPVQKKHFSTSPEKLCKTWENQADFDA